jgi:hypothetical protein
MLLIYLLLAGAFALGWMLRGWIALRDVKEMEQLEARVLDLETKARIRTAASTDAWARRQGLLP